MKKTLLLMPTLASSLILSSVVLAQSAAETESNRILPSIRVRFDKRLKYVGSQKFILYERAQVEQHFFVAADKQGRIKRLYMVQFEGYLPNINATYDYPVTKTVDLGGQTYLVNVQPCSSKIQNQMSLARPLFWRPRVIALVSQLCINVLCV